METGVVEIVSLGAAALALYVLWAPRAPKLQANQTGDGVDWAAIWADIKTRFAPPGPAPGPASAPGPDLKLPDPDSLPDYGPPDPPWVVGSQSMEWFSNNPPSRSNDDDQWIADRIRADFADAQSVTSGPRMIM